MTGSDIVYYKAVGDDGGVIDNAAPITTGQLHNLLPEITAILAETGGVVYRKVFVKNVHGSDTALGMDIAMTRFSDADDYMAIFPGTVDDTTANFNITKMYGVTKANAELDRGTKVVPVDVEGGQTLSDLYADGDKITFIDAVTGFKLVKVTIAVAGVGASSLTIVEDVPVEIVLNGAYIANTIVVGDISSGTSYPLWIRQTVPQFCQSYVNSFLGINSLFVSS